MRSQKRREKLFLLCASARDKTTFTSIKFIFVATMPPLQQSLTISLLRVALWWQKWQRTGDFNTFHVIFGAETLFFSSFSFLLRRLFAPVKVPSRSFESAFSLSAPWVGTISSMGWSNPLHPMEQQETLILMQSYAL
jgi:hypothetical protein